VADDTGTDEIPTVASLASSPVEEQALATIRQLIQSGDADPRQPDIHTASDSTGSVWVTVDARGGTTEVDIEHAWRDRLDPAGFAGALFEAYVAAREEAIIALAVRTVAAEDAGGDPAGPSSDVAGSPWVNLASTPPDPVDGLENWLVWLEDTFTQMDLRLEEMARLAAEASMHHHQTSTHGLLTAELRGDTVVAITGDPARIWHADIEYLHAEALEVLAAARRSRGG
jgi:hypothetical protein